MEELLELGVDLLGDVEAELHFAEVGGEVADGAGILSVGIGRDTAHVGGRMGNFILMDYIYE